MARRPRTTPRRIRVPVDSAPNGADLCLQCGMCCDGTLFLRATARPGDREMIARHGLSRDPDVSDGFDMPCPAFRDGCCSLYSVERPHICGAYRCRPLMQYEAGEATLEECVETVRMVQALARTLEDEMNLAPGAFTRRALSDFFARHPVRDDPRYRPFLSAFDRLVYLGVKYFGYDIESVEEIPTEAVPA